MDRGFSVGANKTPGAISALAATKIVRAAWMDTLTNGVRSTTVIACVIRCSPGEG